MERDIQDIQLACFNLGENLFAVDIMRIREIVLPQKMSNLPVASHLLEGVINLRGSVIPVMDLRRRFGMPAAASTIPGKLLIVALAGQTLALAVDNVLEVISVPALEIKPPPASIDTVGMEFLLGVCLSGDRVFMILDVDSLLVTAELKQVTPILHNM